MLDLLRRIIGAYPCFICGRPRWRHSSRAIAACDNRPLPLVLTEAGWQRLGEHGIGGTVVADQAEGDDDRAAS
jgi:hypothetical protein